MTEACVSRSPDELKMEFPSRWSSYHRASVEHRLVKEMRLLDLNISQPEGLVLLDVGIGEGPYVAGYLARGFRVIGLDNNPEGLCQLQTSLGDRERLSLVQGDAGRLPFRDASVDVVFMCQFLEHLNEPTLALKEAFRVLKPGGYLYLDVPWWHQLFRPLSAYSLRQLQHFKDDGQAPLLLGAFFRSEGAKVERRSWATLLIMLIQLLPTFKEIHPEQFIEEYIGGERAEGNLHLHFYFPGEWQGLVEAANFRTRQVTGAWLTPPPLNRLRFFNRLFLRMESRLGDRLLARLGQVLIIVTVKPARRPG